MSRLELSLIYTDSELAVTSFNPDFSAEFLVFSLFSLFEFPASRVVRLVSTDLLYVFRMVTYEE